jgi:hypothetical protein
MIAAVGSVLLTPWNWYSNPDAALVEALVSLGLRTSTRSEYAPPRPKKYSGLLREFTVE